MVEDGRTVRNIQVKALVRCGKWGKKQSRKEARYYNGQIITAFYMVASEGLADKETYEQRLKREEQTACVSVTFLLL